MTLAVRNSQKNASLKCFVKATELRAIYCKLKIHLVFSLSHKGLTDARRVQLQQVITDWRDSHPPRERNQEEQEELYAHTQTLLQRHYYLSRQTRRKEQERLATLARIDTDIELLLSAPKLDGAATAVASEHFVCRSVPIANRAKMLHQEKLRRLRLPWWKQLQQLDDQDDSTYVIDKQDVLVIDGKVM